MPALSYAVIILFTRRSKTLSAGISILTMVACFILSIGILLEFVKRDPTQPLPNLTWTWLQVPPWNAHVGVLIDPLCINMLLVVTLVSLLVQIYSLGYMHDDERFSVYYSYLSLFSASMLLLVVANNYLQIFIGWELVGLCSYLLIGFWFFKPEAADACKKAFIVNRIGDMGFIMGVITIGMVFQTFDFAEVQKLVTQGLADHTYQTTLHRGNSPPPFLRRGGEERPVSAPCLAARRHGRSDARFRPDSCRHHGSCGCLHGCPYLYPLLG